MRNLKLHFVPSGRLPFALASNLPRPDQSAHSSAAHSSNRSPRSSIDLDFQPAVSMTSATSPAITNCRAFSSRWPALRR